jgi:(E)-4-hydroxy-3-methylbut-2-enyl-diphosphate synthase
MKQHEASQFNDLPGSGSGSLHVVARRISRKVRVGSLVIGGGEPVVVQEMTSTLTSDVTATVAGIRQLQEDDCRLVRVAVPDEDSARALRSIKENTGVLLVADVHYDYRLALLAIEAGVDKLRINPGNIGGRAKVAALASAAAERGIPIRVGVNSGSLEKQVMRTYGGATPQAMAESALGQVRILEKHGFTQIVVSAKAPDIRLTVEANRLIASQVDYPIHIGITESGIGDEGITRSAMGLSILLLDGIGDTVRVSLTEEDRRVNLRLCRRVLDGLGIPWV